MHKYLKTIVASVCLTAVILIYLTPLAASAGEADRQARLPGEPVDSKWDQYVPGQVIVKYKPQMSAQSKQSAMSSFGGVEVLSEIGSTGGEKAQLVSLEPEVSVQDAVARLNARGDVQYAEPNYIYHATFEPDDPYYDNQWGLENTGQTIGGTSGTVGADVDAEAAWDIERGTSDVHVAIIDTGCDFTHPDLKSKLLSNGYNYAGISQTSYNNEAYFGYAYQYFAQSIRGTGCNLTHFGFAAKKVGSPSQGINVWVTNSLNATTPLASYTVSPLEVSSEGNEIYKKLDNTVKLQNGDTYYLWIWTNNYDAYNYYTIFYNYGLLSYDTYVEGATWYWDGWDWVEDVGSDFYFRTNANSNPRDDNGHGTHCAGISAAVTDNGVGVAGTCPRAKVLPVKALNAAGSGSNAAITNGIYHAADRNPEIISMSLGGPGNSSAMQEACTYAHDKGCTVFASSGNTGDGTINYPASYNDVISVAATTNRDAKADFSTYNRYVDLAAPGKDIYSTMPTYPVTSNSQGYSQNYEYLSGTSMACPMAAGVGALLKSNSPGLSPDAVESTLESTADDLGNAGRDNRFGWGRVNAASALGGGSQPAWYLAEGTTAWGFSTYITIENPNSTAVDADVTYMPTGASPVTETMGLPANSQTTLTNDHIMGRVGTNDFSTKVECTDSSKSIAVDRTITWTGAGAASPEAHNSVGVTSPATTWYLPEGSSRWGFETWLLIQNPNSTEATCNITYMVEGGAPVTVTETVPASSRESYSLTEHAGEVDASIKVESDVPVIPERAMYRNSRREGHDSIGTTTPASNYYLAEGTTGWGFTTYVLIQNPNSQAVDVTVTYLTTYGEVPHPENPVHMEASSRKTIRVNDYLTDTDFSTRVTCSSSIIAERAMYWDNGTGEACHDSIGMDSPHKTFYLPDGQAGGGYETWTLVANPNAEPVDVRVSYLTPDGSGNVSFEDTIGANSRTSYELAQHIPDGRAAVLVTSLTQGSRIMCERAMYWNGRGAGTDTIGGYSD